MPRRWLWIQLAIGWLPVWALFVTLLSAAHQELSVWGAALVATRMVVAGAILGPLVARVVRRLPWPHPMRVSFALWHLVAATAYGGTWVLMNSIIDSVVRAQLTLFVSYLLAPFVILGVWLYVMTAGVLYAADATTRASRAELVAAQSQLAALRGQLNPHFLFNALHTVVQLTHRAPDRAARAAEDIAGLLRTSLEETRDLVPLVDEWRFVERYLEMERIRFGDRLIVQHNLAPAAMDALLPSFALQTLVENAVRHGAAPRVDATTIVIRASLGQDTLEVTVQDNGVGTTNSALQSSSGTGLRRLRERLTVLYQGAATLTLNAGHDGVTAILRTPQERDG